MYKDILLPIDLSDEHSWKKSLATAVEFAQRFQARLHIMTVLPTFNMPMVGSFFPEGFEQKAHEQANKEVHAFVSEHIPKDVTTQTVVAVGSVYEEILNQADKLNCDLIVMGRSGETHSNFLLGPNAARVVRHANRSVLVVN